MTYREHWQPSVPGGPSGFWATHRVTKAMLIGLAAIHVLMAVIRSVNPGAAGDIVAFFALSPNGVFRQFRLWQLVTCAVFHYDMWHLLFNCIGIWFFGRLIEERLGARRYLLFALATVLTASLAFLLQAALLDEDVPMLGASGFDFGVIVLCALWYPRLTVLLFFVLPTPLWALALLFVFIELMMLFETTGGIAHSAHLGGALYGFLYHRFGGGLDRILASVDGWQAARRQRRAEQARREEEELRKQVDRILDKVNREGMAALSEEERRFLKEASERLRR